MKFHTETYKSTSMLLRLVGLYITRRQLAA